MKPMLPHEGLELATFLSLVLMSDLMWHCCGIQKYQKCNSAYYGKLSMYNPCHYSVFAHVSVDHVMRPDIAIAHIPINPSPFLPTGYFGISVPEGILLRIKWWWLLTPSVHNVPLYCQRMELQCLQMSTWYQSAPQAH